MMMMIMVGIILEAILATLMSSEYFFFIALALKLANKNSIKVLSISEFQISLDCFDF